MVVANLILGIVVSHHLQADYDTSLLAKARALVALTEHEPEGVELEFADEFMPEFEATENPEYFQLWLDNGTVLNRSHPLGYREDGTSLSGAEALQYQDLPQLAPRSEQPRFHDLGLPDGVVHIVVGSGLRPLQDIREQVERLDVDSLHTRLTMCHPTISNSIPSSSSSTDYSSGWKPRFGASVSLPRMSRVTN